MFENYTVPTVQILIIYIVKKLAKVVYIHRVIVCVLIIDVHTSEMGGCLCLNFSRI